MATGQHLSTGSAHEPHVPTTRAVTSASKTTPPTSTWTIDDLAGKAGPFGKTGAPLAGAGQGEATSSCRPRHSRRAISLTGVRSPSPPLATETPIGTPATEASQRREALSRHAPPVGRVANRRTERPMNQKEGVKPPPLRRHPDQPRGARSGQPLAALATRGLRRREVRSGRAAAATAVPNLWSAPAPPAAATAAAATWSKI